jgi:hypothetical protein
MPMRMFLAWISEKWLEASNLKERYKTGLERKNEK